MKTINVKIPTMKSAHCMMTVTNALQGLKDVKLKNISPGQAEIELLNDNQVSVTEAIKNAGYQVSEIETILTMDNKTFKTNIKCEGCLAKVTPHLNESVGEGKWQVDLNNPAKTLHILVDSSASTVKAAVEKAGFKAEEM